MLTCIQNHKASKWITGLMLVGVTLSFPVSFIKLMTDSQNPSRITAAEHLSQKPSVATITPDDQNNSISGKETQSIGQTAQKLDQSIQTQAKPPVAVKNTQVSWTPNKQPAPVQRRSDRNKTNIYLLARVIHAEARGEPLEGQVAVGAVLLNRLQDKRFPKTLSQIVFKHGEFCTVRDGQVWMTPSSQAIRAARLAASGWDPTGGAVYFYNPAKTTSRWIWSRPVVNKIGNHFFAV